MRVLSVALAISAALHGAAIAWVQLNPVDTEQAPTVTRTVVEIVPAAAAEPEPMTVALLDDHTVVATAPETGRATPRPDPRKVSRPTAPAISTGATTEPATTTLTPVEPSPPSRNPLMTMRKPGVPAPGDVTLAPGTHPADLVPEHLWGSQPNTKDPKWIANATPDEVTAERMRRIAMYDELNNRELKPDGTGKKSEHKAFRIKVAADGKAKIHDKANVQRTGILSGSFDVTDGLMRQQGIDPYSSYKLKILDETREERVAMGKQHRTQQLAQSRQHMQKNLERLWSMTQDVAERKQGLFELWDDCIENGPNADEEQVVAGKAARDFVVGFIRSKLPANTALAYTSAELARLNKQRKSRAVFAPYL